MIYVSQLANLEQYTSAEFIQSYFATAGGLGRLFQDINNVITKNSPSNSTLSTVQLAQVEDMRREGYDNIYDLNAANGWKMIEHSWYDAYAKEEEDNKVSVAVKSKFFSTETCKQTAARIYDALRKSGDWNWLVFDSEVEDLDEGTCIVSQVSQGFEPGTYTELVFLVACRANIDGSCDVTWQAVNKKSNSNEPDLRRMDFKANACIITPHAGGSAVLWLSRPPSVPVKLFKVPIGRAINVLTGVRSYISKNSSAANVPPAPGSELMPMLGSFSVTLRAKERDMEPDNKKKRKISTTLSITHVQNIVSKTKPGEKHIRPFLFLVSNSVEDGRHRFVRRRHNPQSNIELLPHELIECILSFLDCTTLAAVIPRVSSHFKEFMDDTAMWKRWYINKWGSIEGRLALRYCGDDDPASVFTSSFPNWREVFCEKHLIEDAWKRPEHKVHGFRVVSGHARAIRAIHLSPTCHRIITASLDKLIRVWDAHSGTCIVTAPGASGAVAVTVGYMTLTAGYKSGVVRYYEPNKEVTMRDVRLTESMRGCLFMKNSIATWDEDVELWDETTHQRTHLFNGHSGYISECIVSNNSILYSASRDKTIKLWDMKGGSKIATITGHTRGVNGLALISDHMCVSVSRDKTMRVWDTRKLDGALVTQTHAGKLRCVRASAIGNKISYIKMCTGGSDGVLVLRSDTFEHIWRDPTDQVESIDIDEERLAYGTTVGGIVRYYDFAPHN